MLTSLGGLITASEGVGKAVGVGASFEDVAAEGEAVDDGCAYLNLKVLNLLSELCFQVVDLCL